MPGLLADVFVSSRASAQPSTANDGPYEWSPVSSTLIRGPKSAVLVDTHITTSQNEELVDWVQRLVDASGVRLTTVYITHGHADHFTGMPLLKERFAGVQFVATKGTVEHMRESLSATVWDGFWRKCFPGDLLPPNQFVCAELPDNGYIDLDGHHLIPYSVGHTDTHDTTILWVPDLKLVVAGDVVYGDVHQFLVACNTKAKRREWIAACEFVLSLKPETVIAGHKRPGGVDTVATVRSTIEYIQNFEQFVDSGLVATEELFGAMMKKWGSRVNDHALHRSCEAAEAAFKSGVC